MPPTAPRAMLQTPFLDLTTEDTYPVASTSTLPRPDDPLVTLRAAALQSKKRKAEVAQAKADKKKKKAESTSEVIVLVDSDDEELEEGEMREVTPLEGETKPLLGAMDVDDQYAVERDSRVFGLGVPPLGPRSSLGRANSFPLPGPQYLPLGPSRADVVQAICVESTRIVSELVSYGVTADYLISIGISRDIVAISFNELALRLPDHLAHLAPPAPPHYLFPSEQQGRPAARPAINPNFRPPPGQFSPFQSPVLTNRPQSSSSYLPLLDPTRPSDSILQEEEAMKKKLLLERKEAVRVRNLEQAMLLESEFDALFAVASTSVVPSPRSPGSIEVDGVEVAEEGAAEEKVVDEGINADDLADYESTPPLQTSQASLVRRPVARDFELVPLLTPVIPRKLAYLPSHEVRPPQLVIELSESEESADEGAPSKATTRTMSGAHRSSAMSIVLGNLSSSNERPSSSSSVQSPATTASPASGENKQRLEEKEKEIKAIMMRIQEMEKRKGAVTPTTGTSTPLHTTNGTTNASTTLPILPLPTLDTPTTTTPTRRLDDARALVSVLHQERAELLFDAPASEPLVTAVPTPLPETATDAGAIVGASKFNPYISPFLQFPALRSTSLPPPLSLSSESGSEYPPGLIAWVLRERGVEPGVRICKYEVVEGGKCTDKGCKSTHFGVFEPTKGDWDAWRAFLSETSTDVPITNLPTTETTTTTTTRRSTRSIA